MSFRLILASASPARAVTLRNAGIEPRVVISHVDEDEVLAQIRSTAPVPPHPRDEVLALARAKAEWVARATSPADPADRHRPAAVGDVVVGCDSMLEITTGAETHVVGKPGTAQIARQRWRQMRGGSGVLHTGHWAVRHSADDGAAEPGSAGDTASTTVHFGDLSDTEIEAYVASGEPLNVAGGFTVDGLGGPFITGIEGDYHAVVGISLPLLRDLLGRLGVAITDLWTVNMTTDSVGNKTDTH